MSIRVCYAVRMVRAARCLLLLVLFLGACTAVEKQPLVKTYPEPLSWGETKRQVSQLQRQSPDVREIHFMVEGSRKLFAFYKDGVVHMRTDRDLAGVAEIYGPQILSTENLSGRTILDLGCGNGAFVRDLREKGHDVYGVDLYLEPEYVQEPYVTKNDILKLPFEDDSFDIFFATQVLIKGKGYQTEFFRKALTEVFRVSRPGGRLYVAPVLLSEQELQELVAPFREKMEYKVVPTHQGYGTDMGLQILIVELTE
jgi:SAM-dependent methyltransferase